MNTAAMDKIRDEMEKQAGNPAVVQVGEMMTMLLQQQPEVAQKILQDGKTLEGAYDAIAKRAKEMRGKGNCVCIPPNMALEIVCKYYGIDDAPRAEAPAPAKSTEPDELDLDALLEV